MQPSSAVAFWKHPRTRTGVTGMDYQSADSEHLMKRIRTVQADEGSFSGSNVYSQDDLPKAVVRTLIQGSNVRSSHGIPSTTTNYSSRYCMLWLCRSCVTCFPVVYIQSVMGHMQDGVGSIRNS
ncbi:hypothetical protein ACFX15_002106 [Malus domestica]|uniref:protein TOPLESS-RELATED PROTEIN 2-like n=1 Tax=Malus domestica TaxID=3750 RepID=UPI0039754CCF